MTDASPDPMHDEVLWFGIELAAVAKPRDAAAFKTLLMRFTEAVVREAFEHQDEIRERLAIALPRVNEQHADHDGPSRGAQCPGCHATIVGPFAAHVCERRRELGLIDSSTGAAEAEPKADIHTGETDAASVTPPAAPTTHTPQGAVSVLKAGADLPATEETGTDRPAAPISLPPLAELDSTRDAALDRQCTDCGAGQGELHADGCARLTKAEPIAVPPPGPRPGPGRGHRALTDEQKAQLNRDYRAARAANGGEPVRGWVPKRAAELGVSCQTIYRALDDTMIELMTDAAPPSEQPAKRSQPPDEHAELPHTETPACWCRRKRASRDNVWCKLRTIEKPASQHAALRAPEPRVRRIIGTRY